MGKTLTTYVIIGSDYGEIAEFVHRKHADEALKALETAAEKCFADWTFTILDKEYTHGVFPVEEDEVIYEDD